MPRCRLPDHQGGDVPKGLKAPPAFAATTTLMQAGAMKRGSARPIATTTAPMTKRRREVVEQRGEPERERAGRPRRLPAD